MPVDVEGYRATAHIIVDTRYLPPDKIAPLENLLYGANETEARMPSPQMVFELLNYGDGIIVINNGDGNFTVQGSYENVFYIENGQFQVNNVDASDNGDDTFTIRSTEG